jgi:hypothetical protein
VAIADKLRKSHVRPVVGQNVPEPRAMSAIAQVITTIMDVRIAVAAFESMPDTPIFAKIAVNAAKTAEASDQ